jgi:hypothetical protein
MTTATLVVLSMAVPLALVTTGVVLLALDLGRRPLAPIPMRRRSGGKC